MDYTFSESEVRRISEGDAASLGWAYKKLEYIMNPIVLGNFGYGNIVTEEVIQDAVMRVLKHLPKLPLDKIPNYAKVTAKNLSIDTHRRMNIRKKSIVHMDNVTDNDYGFSESMLCGTTSKLNGRHYEYYEDEDNVPPYDTYDPDMVRRKLVTAIENLTPSYRKIAELYLLDEMTHKEIGNLLGIHSGSSKSNLHKAKIHLREMLGSYEAVISSET